MDSKLKQLTTSYRQVVSIPRATSGTILCAGKKSSPAIRIRYQQTDIDNNEKRNFEKYYHKGDDEWHGFAVEHRNDVVVTSYSNSRKLITKFRHVKKDKDTIPILEILDSSKIISTLDCSEIHGKFYDDTVFQNVSWSQDEDKILYVAEQKEEKKIQFWKEPSEKATEPPRYGIYDFKEDWGEGFVNFSLSRAFIFDVTANKTKEIKGIPSYIAVSCPTFTPDGNGMIFVGYDTRERRLGLRYCDQRPCKLYLFSFKDEKLDCISPDDEWNVRSPRFSPSRKQLAYLTTGRVPEHRNCEILKIMDWKSKKLSTLVDRVKSPKEGEFPGIYCYYLKNQCWTEDENFILLNSSWRSSEAILAINTKDGQILRLQNFKNAQESIHMFDHWKGYILASQQSASKAYHILLGKFDGEDKVEWNTIENVFDVIPRPLCQKLNSFSLTVYSLTPKDGGHTYECILLKPECPKDTKIPLIVFPHGGPHSNNAIGFSTEESFYLLNGFATLRVNYRGSTGYGHDFVSALPGKCGTMDVNDCHNAIEYVLSKEDWVDKDRLLLLGGSHGGFLVGSMIGTFPDLFKASVMINPVTNIASMFYGTDIPDWCLTEIGQDPYTTDEIDLMKAFACSPMSKVNKVKTPVLMVLGLNDKRVPNEQGRQFYYALKKRGVPTKLLTYKDNGHSIAEPACAADLAINVVLFFENYGKLNK